ncbi:hypothetical protein [Sphingomonas crocodyli]|uniref:Uncharacterized protein n=1 Tax=Sphingomonas crocodyli TaxID=1979270 RepID=A0A437LWH4_9SPHN|nr:hypothetical protein [Sphingomonas crocodyli]RVT89742.1 hypothetical protein EOD43_20390 [Sphingomonas crocodyli]
MTTIVLLLIAIGVVPLIVGIVRLRRDPAAIDRRAIAASTILAALAFNLTFFWQEIWLVLPKAMTPGLHPILYHNDHDWTGTAPIVELLQGTGAISTLVSGIAFLFIARRATRPTARLFAWWMAFEGFFQSASQFAIGALIPGNDVGRALTWLGMSNASRGMLLPIVGILMAKASQALVRIDRPAILLPAALSILLIIPFRVPRDPIEVVLIPIVVHLIGTGWVMLGASFTPVKAPPVQGRPALALPFAALLAILLVFQCILRPGIAF